MGKVSVQKIRLKDLAKPSSISPNSNLLPSSSSGSRAAHPLPSSSSASKTALSSSSSGSKTTSSSQPSSSQPKTSSAQGAGNISTARNPKVFKLDIDDLAKATTQEERTLLWADELSKDGQRLNKRHLDVSGLSPVKRRRETITRGRSLPTGPAPLSNTLQAVLDDFGTSGFHFVPDSAEVVNVEDLIASAVVKQGRRRYLASVSGCIVFL